MVATEFMKHVDNIRNKIEEIRDDETKKEATSLSRSLDTIKFSKSLGFKKILNLKEEINKTIGQDDFSEIDSLPQFMGMSIKIKNFFSEIDDYILLSNTESGDMSESIIKFFDIINKLVSEQESKEFDKKIKKRKDEDEIDDEDSPI